MEEFNLERLLESIDLDGIDERISRCPNVSVNEYGSQVYHREANEKRMERLIKRIYEEGIQIKPIIPCA